MAKAVPALQPVEIDCADEGFALEMIENVFARVILGAPARVSLVSDVDVDVVQRGNDGLPCQRHAGG